MIYRFVTRGSVEERITQVAKKKMMLTHLVVRPGMGAKNTMSKQELDDILKFGTEELFKDEEGTEDTAIHYDDKAIEDLLDRTKEGIEQKELLANEYLSSFKVAAYVTKEAEEEEPETEVLKQDVESADPAYWEKLLRHHFEQHQEDLSKTFGKGKRVRKQVNYTDGAVASNNNDDANWNENMSEYNGSDGSANLSDDDDFENREEKGVGRKRMRSNQNDRNSGNVLLPPLLARVAGNIEVLGFNPRQRKSFLNAIMRYGMPPENSQNSPWLARDLRGKPEKHFKAYVSLFMRHLCEPGADNAECFADGVPREGINRQHVLTRIGTMALIRKKVKEYEDKNGEFSMPFEELNDQYINNGDVENNGIVNNNSTNEQIESKKEEDHSVKVKSEKVDLDKNGKIEENGKEEEEHDDKECDEKEATNENAKQEEESKDENEGEIVGDKKKEGEEEDNSEINDDEDKKKEANKMEVDNNEEQNDDKQEKAEQSKDSIKKESIKENNYDEEEIKTKENKENNEQNNGKLTPTEKRSNKPKFMFNIADGGFTELHSIWQTEEKAAVGKEYDIWHRRHDYWLLAGIVKHGYARWQDIQTDPVFNIINEPFKMDINKGNFLEIKNKFIARRFKLLEQALAIEEQLKRAKQLNLTLDQTNSALSLNTKYNEMECLAEANQHLVKEQMGGNKQATIVLKNVLNQIDDLLNDMKLDAGRLPQTLTKVQNVSQRLLLSERTILSRLAGQAQMQQAHNHMLQRQQQLFAQLQQQQLQAQLLQQLQLNLTPEQLQLIQQGLLK